MTVNITAAGKFLLHDFMCSDGNPLFTAKDATEKQPEPTAEAQSGAGKTNKRD
jgi:hypothetical protein